MKVPLKGDGVHDIPPEALFTTMRNILRELASMPLNTASALLAEFRENEAAGTQWLRDRLNNANAQAIEAVPEPSDNDESSSGSRSSTTVSPSRIPSPAYDYDYPSPAQNNSSASLPQSPAATTRADAAEPTAITAAGISSTPANASVVPVASLPFPQAATSALATVGDIQLSSSLTPLATSSAAAQLPIIDRAQVQ